MQTMKECIDRTGCLDAAPKTYLDRAHAKADIIAEYSRTLDLTCGGLDAFAITLQDKEANDLLTESIKFANRRIDELIAEMNKKLREVK